MKNLVVLVPSIKSLVKRAPGFEKKDLATHKLDIMALCEFGCRYCSSNWGNYLRTKRSEFAALTLAQTGKMLFPDTDPNLTFHWPGVLHQLEAELKQRPSTFGTDQVLVFSMLTDGFSPSLVESGTTRKALELVLYYTNFRIRVLTKNAVVGSDEWVRFFAEHKDRFVVGLSTGTIHDNFAKGLELGTSLPSARFDALRNLQRAGVPTYGMFCPIFPGPAGAESTVRDLLQEIDLSTVETVWAEPYNDRSNWQSVRAAYTKKTMQYDWFTDVYERGDKRQWSIYATCLYVALREHAERNGWLHKLKYLLYQDGIHSSDLPLFGDMQGVLLQSKVKSEDSVEAL